MNVLRQVTGAVLSVLLLQLCTGKLRGARLVTGTKIAAVQKFGVTGQSLKQ